ncbi:unnamed protein product [Anisakis simplex]|uniref:DUF727 domain-containing protein n=1 Tax=Anisakis simplex TaxID=6269 RepID=A0A0M3KDQ2_ANISI|nr:unnamed protein product [Anisakis simplex]
MDKQSTKKDEHDKDDEEEDNNDSKLLKEEVNAALKELPFAVEHIAVSEKLPHNDDIVYLNITTCES